MVKKIKNTFLTNENALSSDGAFSFELPIIEISLLLFYFLLHLIVSACLAKFDPI